MSDLPELSRAEWRGEALATGFEPLDAVGMAWLYESRWDVATLARAASVCCPVGQWWASNDGLSHLRGRRAVHYVSRSRLPEVLRARAVCEGLGVEPAWSVGGCARALLRWALGDGHPAPHARGYVGGRWHYYGVRVGSYERVWLWDLDAAYWQLLGRLRTPLPVLLRDGRVLWQEPSSEQWERWACLLGSVGGCKLLRNALVGVSLSGLEPSAYWCRGELRRVSGRVGGHVCLGALVVRACYELTGWAYNTERGACYANTDCVISRRDAPPAVWTDFGLRCSLRATGDAEVRGVGAYRVGDYRTGHYGRALGCGLAHEMAGAWREDVARAVLSWLL